MILFQKIKKIFKRFGPGVITGAADDDPAGIATYSQAGAQFGYQQLWTTIYLLPLMISVQEACARIGAVTGKGLAAVIRENYSKTTLYLLVSLVLIANILNIGADIGAMAAAAKLVIPLPFVVLTLLFTASILILEIFTSYHLYSRVLKWLTLALFSYPLTLIIVKQPWLELIKSTIIPHFELNYTFLFIITGVMGTTISPYLFFWQASQEVEEEKNHHLFNSGQPKIGLGFIKNLRFDNALGMIFSSFTAWCIIVVASTVLYKNGLNDIHSAADAAKALEPLVNSFPNSGFWAKSLFAVGVVGLGFLAIPVLSGSAAYAFTEALSWRQGFNLKLRRAHGFYGVITIATLIGLLINFIGIDPIKALIYTAVINGLVAIPLIFFIQKIAANHKIMGEYSSRSLSKLTLWLTFLTMTIAGLCLLLSLFGIIG